MNGLSVSKDEMSSDVDYECTYCDSNENVLSCRVDDRLEVVCTGCGRYGEVEYIDDEISTGPFFKLV
jgi:hypothetical protein